MKNRITVFFLSFFLIGCKNQKEEAYRIAKAPAVPMCAPVTSDKEWYNSDNKAPLFEGLGDLKFPISTKNELVQKYFNQGLVLAYGFNHAEAARSFYYASKLDPDCAMAQWGYAYVLGPNYNGGMESDNYERAFNACQKAISLSKNNTTAKEIDLINALSQRYVKDPIPDRHQLDVDYSRAMKVLSKKYPNDADIVTIYAESLMNLHPWDLYDKNGTEKEWTAEIVSCLEHVIKTNPKHCGAHHFYIHAVEASKHPEYGLVSAKLFDDGLVPNAGHLVHMPSHIYIRTGNYHKGTRSNIQAIQVDSLYTSACNAQGAYPLAYAQHNYHFMAATATLEGNSKWALMAADKIAQNSNIQLMQQPGWGTIQHYYTIPFYVYVKFGKWKEILQLKNEVPNLKYPEAIKTYAFGMAFVGLNEIENAKQELEQLKIYANAIELKEITIWDINSVFELVQIANKVLEAEILASEKKYSQSIALLKEAIAIEDNLNYNEPPDWFFSVRHNLGAIQIDAGNFAAAIQTYNEDLERLPKNGWALNGLKLAYSKLNNTDKIQELETKINSIWATADVKLFGSKVK